MDKVRIGVAGAGRLGGFHASKAAQNPEVEFVGVVDVFEASRKRVAEQWNVKDFATLEEILPQVDAMIVATPSTTHAEVGRQVLSAGKHLLIEKPATTDGRSALELARLARAKGLVMQVGHVEQYNPAWQAATKRLFEVRSGASPAFVEAERTSGYTFRSTDVGATLDLMIHDLELVLSLIPSEVTRVSAFGFAQFGGFEDASFATLEFANGSIARLKASRIEQTPTRKMTIRTKSQALFVDFAARSAVCQRPKRDILDGKYSPENVSFAEMSARVPSFMREEYEIEELVHDPFDALALENDDFVSAILRGTPSTAPGERAARAVEIAEEITSDIQARSQGAHTPSRRALRIAG